MGRRGEREAGERGNRSPRGFLQRNFPPKAWLCALCPSSSAHLVVQEHPLPVPPPMLTKILSQPLSQKNLGFRAILYKSLMQLHLKYRVQFWLCPVFRTWEKMKKATKIVKMLEYLPHETHGVF